MSVVTRVSFNQSSGQFGPGLDGISYTSFDGITETITFDEGGSAKVKIPFVGSVELARGGISGDVTFKAGIETNFVVSPGAVNTLIPYEVGFDIPESVAAGEVFRIESDYTFQQDDARFSTISPGIGFGTYLVLELDGDVDVVLGAGGSKTEFSLIDGGFVVKAPPITFKTTQGADPFMEGTLGHMPLGTQSLATVDGYGDLVQDGDATLTGSLFGADLVDIATTDVFTAGNVSIDDTGITIFVLRPTNDELFGKAEDANKLKDASSAASNDDATETTDKNKTKTDVSFGNLAQIKLSYPDITIAERDLPGHDDPAVQETDLFDITLDLDNIATTLANAFAIPAPPLEAKLTVEKSFGPVSVGATANYNLFDADLKVGAPLRQTISAEESGFETQFTFQSVDAGGAATGEAIFITTLVPRKTVFFNENNTFLSDAIAAKLIELAADNEQIARDVELFIDFAEGIPGAFTGETGSIAGGVVARAEAEADWVQVRTFTEETVYLAQSQPTLTSITENAPLDPRDGAEFRYVIYDQDTVVSEDGVVDLTSVPTDRVFDLDFDPSADGIFELLTDYVEAPISTTGFVDGTPTMDLVFPDGRDAIAVDVAHRSTVEVQNAAELRAAGDITLSGFQAGVSVFGKAFGKKKSLGVSFGPLFEYSKELFNEPLLDIYSGSFNVTETVFDVSIDGGTTQQGVESYALIVENGTPDDPSVIDAFDQASDTIDGSAEDDTTVSFATAAGANRAAIIDLSAPAPVEATVVDASGINLFTLISVENLRGTGGNDSLTGDAGDNLLFGGEGDDTLSGGGGADLLEGGRGNDILSGDDDSADTLLGGAGFDRLIVSAGADVYDGGTTPAVGANGETVDLDVLSFENVTAAVLIDVHSGVVAVASTDYDGQTYLNFEGFAGSAFEDVLIGHAGRDYFEGGDGADLLFGENLTGTEEERRDLDGDNDRLYGGEGNDTLSGGPGADLLDGGGGTDLVSYAFAPTSVFASLSAGVLLDADDAEPFRPTPGAPDVDFDRIDGRAWRGWAQGDQFRDIENLEGSDFDDILFGDGGSNAIFGGLGNDRLTGGSGGTDSLFGGPGDDILWRQPPDSFARSGTNATAVQAEPAPVPGDTILAIQTDLDPLEDWTPLVSETVFDGGDDFDLVLMDDGYQVSFDYEVPYISVTRLAIEIDTVDIWTIRLTAELETELSASLTSGALQVTTVAEALPADLYVTGFKAPGADEVLVEIDPVLAETFFDNPVDFGGPATVPFQETFVHRPLSLLRDTPQLVADETLTDIEGLSGGFGDDLLEGDDGNNALFGGGGRDGITARGGDDRLGFSEAQSAQDLFSFPGFTPLDVADVIVSSDGPLIEDTIQTYIDAGSDLAALEQLMADLETYKVFDTTFGGSTPYTPLAQHSFLDGGSGTNTLDLRFDRGLPFLPAASTSSATVLLDGFSSRSAIVQTDGSLGLGEVRLADLEYVSVGASETMDALLLNIQNIIGTANGDSLTGSAGANEIEGGGGADTIDGGDGEDTASYANADAGVELVVLPDGTLFSSFGDAAGDVISGVETIAGSEHGDFLGTFAPGSVGSVGSVALDDLQAFDGAGGDDFLLVDLPGIDYFGSEGEDRFQLSFPDVAAGTTGILDGGADTDLLIIQPEGAIIETTLVQTVDGPELTVTDGTHSWTVRNVEYVRDFDTGTTIFLGNEDPDPGPSADLTLSEDPLSPFSIAPDGIDQLDTTAIRIDALPENGVIQYQPGGTGALTDVVLLQELTPAEAATLIFVPDQNFALPVDTDTQVFTSELTGDALTRTELVAATLGEAEDSALRYETFDLSYVPTGEDETARVARTLDIRAQTYDGVSLDFAPITDTQAPGIVLETVTFAGEALAADLGFSESRVPLGRLGEDQLFEVTEIPENGVLVARDDDTGIETELQVGDRFAAAVSLSLRSDGPIISAGASVGIQPVESIEIAVVDLPDGGILFNPNVDFPVTLPESLDDATLYQLADLPDDGTLFLRDPITGERVELSAGDILDTAHFANLTFRADAGRTETTSTAAEADAIAQQQNTLTDLGAFASGDTPETELVSTAVRQDSTALRLSVTPEMPLLPEIDGVTVDLGGTGDTQILSWQEIIDLTDVTGMETELRAQTWTQRTGEDGGTGELYLVATLDQSLPEIWNAGVVAEVVAQLGETASGVDGAPSIHLASIADAVENQFVFDLALQTPDAVFASAIGPIIGGTTPADADALDTMSDGIFWQDGTTSSFTAWTSGAPVLEADLQPYIQYEPTLYDTGDPENPVLLPTWGENVGADGVAGKPFSYVLETRSVATEFNDLLLGGTADETIRAGVGDDIVRGGDGADVIAGESGNDVLEGGAGDDTLSGGVGADLFVLARDAGSDLVTDFSLSEGDRIDLSQMALGSLSELQVYTIEVTDVDLGLITNTVLTAYNTVLTLQAFDHGATPLYFADFTGVSVQLASAMPGLDELTLSVGDVVDEAVVPDLRYQADRDATGDVGSVTLEARDPWALPDDVTGLWVDDPRSADGDGRATVSRSITLDPVNDAPRAADHAYLISEGTPLEGRDPEYKLTATDPEGDAVTFELVEGPEVGTLEFDSDGGFYYEPDPTADLDALPTPGVVTFRYAATDGTSRTIRTVTITIEPAPEARAVQLGVTETFEGKSLLFGIGADDSIVGSAEADLLIGDFGRDSLDGLAGDDELRGEQGDDWLTGGSGADTFAFGTGDGDDTITDFEDGIDLIDLSGFTDPITTFIIAQVGPDTVVTVDNETITLLNTTASDFSEDDFIGAPEILSPVPTEFADTLEGTDGDDTIDMLAGDDSYSAGEGADSAIGNDGDDTLEGEGGNDTLTGDDGEDVLIGGLGEDSLTGGGEDDSLDGGDDNDVLDGGPGWDTIDAGDGNDTATGGFGNDSIDGGDGNDSLAGDEADDTINGGAGNDSIDGGTGDNSLNGEAGDDTIRGGRNADEISGGADNDSLDGRSGSDTITGGGGADVLKGGNGDDDLDAGDGNDLVFGGDGRDTILGGLGNDTLRGNDGGDEISGGDGADSIFGGDGDDSLVGGDGHDTLTGNTGENTLIGGAGNDLLLGGENDDSLEGGDGNDFLDGAAGWDTIDAGDGDDTVHGEFGNDSIDGGAGNDSLRGNEASDTINGGTGNDRIDGGTGDNALFGEAGEDTIRGGRDADVIDGGADNDKLDGRSGNDTIDGGTGDDEIKGGNGYDSLAGGADNDVLLAGNGNDTLLGGLGNDTLRGGADNDEANGDDGNDVVRGGSGDDTLSGGDGNDILVGNAGFDALDGGDGQDRLVGGSDGDTLKGGDGLDTLIGSDGLDLLEGEDGNDLLRGGSQSDTLDGGAGEDTLTGGGVDDILIGSLGDDTLRGNSGADVFVYNGFADSGVDVIVGFNPDQDMIRMSGVTFGDLDIQQSGNNVTVQWDMGLAILNDTDVDDVTASVFDFVV